MNFKWAKGHVREVVLGVLILSNLFVWFALFQRQPGPLKVYFLDVGQGDSILIDSPSHGRVLIDGGKNRKVLSELGKILPFADRRIDLVIATHPDADHVGGLVAVSERYKVGLTLDNKSAKRGQVINFGDGAKLTILFPDRDIAGWDDNDASVVARLDYGEFSTLFTGDATIRTENILLERNRNILDVDVLKAGHHGSRTSTSLMFAEATSPEYSIISAGRGNTYGHPHQEVLNILNRVGAKILSTIDSGTIKFETDGNKIELK